MFKVKIKLVFKKRIKVIVFGKIKYKYVYRFYLV